MRAFRVLAMPGPTTRPPRLTGAVVAMALIQGSHVG
jgi:hypothetical protein